MEYYAAVKKNKTAIYVLIWSNVQGVWISKNSNAQRFATICVKNFLQRVCYVYIYPYTNIKIRKYVQEINRSDCYVTGNEVETGQRQCEDLRLYAKL